MNIRFKNTVSSVALFAATVSGAASVAVAQDQDEVDGNVSQIIVTARKREESILDVPLAVTALQAEDLRSAAIDNIVDIANIAPGLDFETFFTSPGRQESTPFIRGIVVDAALPNPLAQPVGVFIDGIFVTGGTRNIGIEDLQRVEVIKGPQSATFGRATFAGAINFVTADPSDELRIKVSGTAATRDEYEGILTVEGPLSETLSARLTGRYSYNGGHFKDGNNPSQQLGKEETYSIGATVLWEPTDNWRTRIRGFHSKIDDGPAAAQLVDSTFNNFGPFDDGDESIFSGILPGFGGSDTPFLNTTDTELGFVIAALEGGNTITLIDDVLAKGFGLHINSTRASLDTSYEFEDSGVTLDAIIGYSREKNSNLYDNDFTGDPAYTVFNPNQFEDVSGEVRLSGSGLNDRLQWSIGGNYYDALYDNNFTFVGFTGAFSGVSPATFAFLFSSESGVTRRFVQNYGGFLQLEYDITEQISVSFDGRYQTDKIRQRGNFVQSGEAIPASDGVDVAASPAKFKNFLPRGTIDYKPAENTLLYFTYSEGNLPGGFNGSFLNMTPDQQAEVAQNFPLVGETFGEEKLRNFEFGWKQSAFDNRLNIALSVFKMKRSNEVVSTVVGVTNDMAGLPGQPPLETFTLLLNAQTTRALGFELEADWSVSDSFDIGGTLALVDSEVVAFPEVAESVGDVRDVLGSSASSVGQKAPRFAKWRGSLNATYTHAESFDLFGNDMRWFTRGDLFYTGKRYLSLVNVGQSPTAVVANLRTGLRSDTATFEFFVSNLFGEDAPTAANNTSDLSFAAAGFSTEATTIGLRDRRQFGFRASFEF